LKPREVLVKVKAVGLCHTDLSVKAGSLPTNYPVVLGHEGSGVIEEVGESITEFEKGDHVVLSYGSCGNCRPCLEGNRGYCLDFIPLNFLNKRLYDEDSVFENKINGSFFQQSSFAEYAIVSD
jgi:aryl-alcohol dehydrogenase